MKAFNGGGGMLGATAGAAAGATTGWVTSVDGIGGATSVGGATAWAVSRSGVTGVVGSARGAAGASGAWTVLLAMVIGASVAADTGPPARLLLSNVPAGSVLVESAGGALECVDGVAIDEAVSALICGELVTGFGLVGVMGLGRAACGDPSAVVRGEPGIEAGVENDPATGGRPLEAAVTSEGMGL